MNRRTLRTVCLPAAILPALAGGCEVSGLGGLLDLFGQSVTIIVENDTRFAATPDVRIGESRNVVEDFLSESEPVAGFGANGTIPPNQTATVRVSCNGDLELIAIGKVRFQNILGLDAGEVDIDENVRRDTDFDCGDVIRIRLSGSLFSFESAIDVETLSTGTDAALPVDEIGSEIADILDELFS